MKGGVVTFVMNRRSKVVHQKIDGKSYEQCNLDDIHPFNLVDIPVGDLEDRLQQGARKCLRCFRAES